MKTHPILISAGALLAAVCVPLSAASAVNPSASSTLIERGRHLVEDVALCGDCHTPRLPTGQLDPTKTLQGSVLGFKPLVEMPWSPVAPSIAQLGGRDPAAVQHLLTHASRPDGSLPLPPMPAFRLSEPEAQAVIAYLQSLPTN